MVPLYGICCIGLAMTGALLDAVVRSDGKDGVGHPVLWGRVVARAPHLPV